MRRGRVVTFSERMRKITNRQAQVKFWAGLDATDGNVDYHGKGIVKLYRQEL